ncbi:MAG: hypothetical protein ACRDHK_11350 [Actinomycetota bacterium]
MSDESELEREQDERLRVLARSYNPPPLTPRERMWTAIQSRRHAARPGDHPLSPPSVRPSRWLAWVTGIAALLAIGVAIGRVSVGPSVTPTRETTTAAAPADTSGPSAALTVATTQHLSRVETLLTDFRLTGADSLLGGQARDLLISTRLLLDSRAVEDPRTRALLEDLELILVQIAQLGPAGRDQELDLITDGLEQRQVIPRLRTAGSAGPHRIAGAS